MNTRKVRVDLVEQARQLRMQAEDLERKVAMARGTKDKVVRDGADFVGDQGSTEQLMVVIHRLLVERAMTFQDLLHATGARDNRIKGVIMRLQREGVMLVNLSPLPGKALWFCPDPAVLERLTRAKRASARR